MSVKLTKGGKVSLNKESPGLSKIYAGLGWDMNTFDGSEFDLDSEVFMLDSRGKVPFDECFIFYFNKKSPDGSIEHLGDNRRGGSVDEAGNKLDDEGINIDLDRIPENIVKLSFSVSIYKAEERRQNFGMVQNAYIRIVDVATQKEICRYDLTNEAYNETAIIIGEIYRYNSEWRFSAVGQGFKGGLRPLAINFGVDVE